MFQRAPEAAPGTLEGAGRSTRSRENREHSCHMLRANPTQKQRKNSKKLDIYPLPPGLPPTHCRAGTRAATWQSWAGAGGGVRSMCHWPRCSPASGIPLYTELTNTWQSPAPFHSLLGTRLDHHTRPGPITNTSHALSAPC